MLTPIGNVVTTVFFFFQINKIFYSVELALWGVYAYGKRGYDRLFYFYIDFFSFFSKKQNAAS